MLSHLRRIRGRLLFGCSCQDWESLRPALFPKSFGNLQRIDIQVVPPGCFVTRLMKASRQTSCSLNSRPTMRAAR